MSNNFQVVIHIVDRPLTFSGKNKFLEYIDLQRKQGGNDDVGQPVWKKFEHLPLLKIIDDRIEMDGFTVEYPAEDTIPKSNIYNKKGIPLINIH
jgi:hypothetical protein